MQNATADDLPAILELLNINQLPYAGLELYGSSAFLRSVAVSVDQRSSGLGIRLVNAQLEAARTFGMQSVSLLTTTAETYLPRFGFAVMLRSKLAAELQASLELRGACPDSAICMDLSLEQCI